MIAENEGTAVRTWFSSVVNPDSPFGPVVRIDALLANEISP